MNPVLVSTLKERLKEWMDFDGAEHALAVCLGMIPSAPEYYFKNKGVFWSDNPVGNALGDILNRLVEAGALEKNEECQFRWNSAFKMR